MRRHGLAAASFALVVLWWLWPILGHASSSIPGEGPGDNLIFVWNVWWTRFALNHPGQSVLFSPLLLHPFGADLTLHTNTLLPALLVAPIANPVLGQNLLIAAHLFLNFVCAYALAWRETRHWTGSLTAAAAFGWSPFVSAHLPGHFNLIAAWVLPLVALTALAARDRPTRAISVVAGFVLGATAYVDYYYFAYALVLLNLLWIADAVSMKRVTSESRPWHRTATRIVAAFLILDALVVLWILTTGGGDLRAAGMRISAHGIANPIAAAWLVFLLWLCAVAWRRYRPAVNFQRLRDRVPIAITSAIVVAVVLAPLIVRAVTLWRSGDYTTQRYFWRSAPPGVDLMSLVLGNPFSLVYGSFVAPAYKALSVDLVENVAWIPLALIALTIVGVRQRRPGAAQWLLPLVVFGVWSLGPYVEVAGHGTTMWLPATVVRWIPVLSNARIPARAVVVVTLCCAMLSAYGVAWMVERRRGLGIALLALLILDLVPRPTTRYELPSSRAYAIVRNDTEAGAVCELPLGLRDGFGEVGLFDARVLYYQTVHQRPIAGGFVARIPLSVFERYRSLPIVGSLLRLSAGGSLAVEHPEADRAHAAETVSSLGIRYFVINHATASPDLIAYVRRVLPLRLAAQDDQRAVYVVDPSAF